MSLVAAVAFAAVAAGGADPRIALVDLQRTGEERRALAEVDRLRTADATAASELGLTLLRGHLLERLGRAAEATSAFAQSIGETPDLAPWARLRLAETQLGMGHPEVAAGVAATLVLHPAPPAVVARAVEVLIAGIRRGGDCRLLGGLGAVRNLPRELARPLEAAGAECDLRRGQVAAGQRRLLALLAVDSGDLAAIDAAGIWTDRFALPPDRRARRAIGEALAAQRDFERAVPALEAALAGAERTGSESDSATLYRLGRAQFWLGRYTLAARTFDELSRTTRSVSMRADSRYQQARCQELEGDRAGALALYREAFDIEPRGEWAGPALLGRLRLDWLAGRRLDATESLERLGADRSLASALARGAVFLAASEIVSGTAGAEVAGWLDRAERSGAASVQEIAYWRGRAAELERRPADAVRRYLEAQRDNPFHPLAGAARTRLAQPELRPLVEATVRNLARGSTLEEVRSVWILSGPVRAMALAARSRALAALGDLPDLPTWIRWSPVPTAEWPLWRSHLGRPEERLLALGLFGDGSAAIGRHFPPGRPQLAFTASQILEAQEESGLAIELSERLFDSKPELLPIDWVSPDLRRLLYPLPHRRALLAQASLHRIDPWLLAAILREESRFRPEAISPAGARGLAQLVLPTARRLAAALALQTPEANDLHRPDVAIPLAASYLAELSARFDGFEPAILAAYNAGEAQTDLWRSYCSTREPEELLAKIGFRETRSYVVRVLESRAHYAALYGL